MQWILIELMDFDRVGSNDYLGSLVIPKSYFNPKTLKTQHCKSYLLENLQNVSPANFEPPVKVAREAQENLKDASQDHGGKKKTLERVVTFESFKKKIVNKINISHFKHLKLAADMEYYSVL